MSVARRCSRSRPWPRTARCRAIARRKVRDLADDERLAELLADEVERWAARWWAARASEG